MASLTTEQYIDFAYALWKEVIQNITTRTGAA